MGYSFQRGDERESEIMKGEGGGGKIGRQA
jgi:hypothetical protein